MAKIDLNTPPYFDDYNENKKFYKILFRPGRAVQARELTQLQSILQNQVARLGSHFFKHSSIVYPEGAMGFTFSNNTVYIKLESTSTSKTATKNEVEYYWLGKDVESSQGVKGTVVGYNMFDSSTEIGTKVIRLYVDLKSAGAAGAKNFSAGQTISTKTDIGTTLTASISITDYSVGRISKVSVPKSIYFWNDYFVLVDAQTLFLEPPEDVISESLQWTLKPSYDIYIKIAESIVDASDDESLYDNANGSPNYGGVGADRLRIDATLVKRPLQTIEQDVILVARIQDGKVTEAPLVDKSKLNIADKVLAKRTYEESGNYTLRPFLIEALPFISTKANDRGLYTEDTLSFGFATGTTNEDDLNESEARQKARDLSTSLFKLKDPAAFARLGEDGLRRWYPGTSYNTVNDSTSFISLCDSMIGLQVDPGVAYVKGYRVEFIAPTYHAVRKARTSDFLPVRKIWTPLGNYILVKDVFGTLSVDGSYPYDDIQLHSDILDLSAITPTIPTDTTQIGTARVYSIDVFSGTPGSKNCVYQIGIFDLKLNAGKKFSQVKSIYSSGRTVDSGTFLANLVLKDSTKNPALIFTGTIEKISTPYVVTHDETPIATQPKAARVLFNTANKREIFIAFDTGEQGIAARNSCFDNLSLGSAVKINDAIEYLITSVEKNDSVAKGSVGYGVAPSASPETAVVVATSSGKNFSVQNTILDNDRLVVMAAGSVVPTTQTVPADATTQGPENLVTDAASQINGENRTFVTAKPAIENSSKRVRIIVTEPVLGAIDDANRQFRISNEAIAGTVKLYFGTTGKAPSFTGQTPVVAGDTEVSATTYKVLGNLITFKDDLPIATVLPKKTGTQDNLLTARYETYVSGVGVNTANQPTVTLSFAPTFITSSSDRTSVRAKYEYYSYTVSGKELHFQDAPTGSITVKYDYVNTRGVKIVLDKELDLSGSSSSYSGLNKGVDKIAIVRKIKGKGTLWKSNPGEKVEAGDWVAIGTGDNRRIYRVFSTPTNDNELNLHPDPSVAANAPWVNDSKMTYLIPEDVQDGSGGSGAGLVYQLPHNMIRTIRGGDKNNPDETSFETYYATKRYAGLSWSVKTDGSSLVTLDGIVSGTGADYSQEIFSFFSPTLYALVDMTTGFWFELFDGNNVDVNTFSAINDRDPSTFKATVVVDRNSTKSSVRFNIPRHSSATETRRLLAITTLDKYGKAAKENTKTLIGTEDTPVPLTTTAIPGRDISLGKADVFKVYRIIESPSATVAPDSSATDLNDPYRTSALGHKIVTSLYEFDNGQTDYYYGIASVRRRSGVAPAAGRIRIEFSYFDHGDSGNYFSVDSYTNVPYHEIPTFVSDKGDKFDLKGCIDFRPRVDDDIPLNAIDGTLNFKKYHELPKDFVCSYHVYLSRKDLFCLTEDGEFVIKEGEPAMTPNYPAEPENGMALSQIQLLPYTASKNEVILNLIDQKRYTMRDISKIESRVKTLENYTSLNLLEKDTKELTIKNALGQDKFKHGFMSNAFHDNSMADIVHPDHQSAPLFNPGELRPKIAVNHVDLIEASLLHDTTQAIKAHREAYNYTRSERNDRKQKFAIYTLDYTHSSWQEQPLCSRVINVNPYAAQTFSGALKISPWTDTWRETKVADPLKVSDESAWQATKNSYGDSNEKLVWESTIQEWSGAWETKDPRASNKFDVETATDHWPAANGEYLDMHGNKVTASTLEEGDWIIIPPGVFGAGQRVRFSKKRGTGRQGYTQRKVMDGFEFTTGIKSQFQDLGWSNPVSMGKKIIDVQAAEFIRSKEISYDGRGFFPNTRLYAYFDGSDVTNYCYPEVGFGTVTEDPANVIVDLSPASVPSKSALVSFGQTAETGTGAPNLDPNVPTVTYNPSQSYVAVTEASTLVALSDFNYANISAATSGLRDAILTGTVSVTGGQRDELVGVGTKFKTELIIGSVLVFSSDGQEAVVKSIESDTQAKLKYSLVSQVTAESAADKLEALNTKYVGKYIHIDGSSNASRNIIDKRINAVEYDGKGINGNANEKLRFLLGSGLLIEPTATAETVSLKIKKNPLGSGAGQRTVQLKCDSTGRVKGKFLVPDPTVTSNPRFRTGDRIFRLTNSASNEVLPSVSKADAPYSAKGWIDVEQETIYRTRLFRENQSGYTKDKKPIKQVQIFDIWGEVEPFDPIAQTFTVKEDTGIFITAVDVFFFSKDPELDVTLQIRPLDDGGNPSNKLLYEKVLAANEVVLNKVDLARQTLTVIGATASTAIAGFNKGPWNVSTQGDGIYDVKSREYESAIKAGRSVGNTLRIIDKNQDANLAPFSYAAASNAFKDAGSHMIPTRFVFDYPVYLKGGNSNYCFVLLSNSVPKGENVEDTYQAYFAQTGPIFSHQDRATPVHRITTVDSDEKEINLSLGTSEPITTVATDGVLFKSINGISWESDQTADLKFNIHRAVFKNGKNAQIDFVNEELPLYDMSADPFMTHKGSGKIRVHHRNHGFIAGKSYVVFNGVEGELNGILVQHLTHPSQGAHLVESCTLDSYIIDLQVSNGTTNGNSVVKNAGIVATNTGNVGGFNVVSSTNIRFEEMMILTNAFASEKTSITWSVTPVRGAGTQDLDRIQLAYSRPTPYPLSSEAELAFDESMQICSSINENRFITDDGSGSKFSRKSLKVTAILSSESPNITPVIDTERLSATIKTVRINDPKGLGIVDNINDEIFDSLLFVGPTTTTINTIAHFTSSADAASKLHFSDTDNVLTGSSFTVNGRRVLGVGSLFTIELQVGDTITNSTTQQKRTVVEVIDDTTLVLDEEFTSVSGSASLKLSYNPPKLKFKTANPELAKSLSALKIGQYTSLSGTTGNKRNFTDKIVLNVSYTPFETKIDPELIAPKLCEIEVDHYLPDGTSAGFEDSSTLQLTQKNQYIDEIAPAFGSCAAKYVMRELKLAKPANTLKIIFDGCRTLGSYIDVYYKIASTDDQDSIDSLTWTKLEYSVEESGNLTYIEPEPNPNSLSFSEYEANALNLKPFLTAKVKIVLRGKNPASYPKVKNFRIIALED
jgi:Domain of unknown function (DUF4815)